MVHDHVRDSRNDEDETQHAGVLLATTSYRPPCSRDPGVYSETGYRITHHDPLEWRKLPAVDEDLPAFTVSTSPYGHMFSDEGSWEYDRDKQLQKLSEFWDVLEPAQSLVFFYLKDGQPFLETSDRILCGIGRLQRLGPQVYFGEKSPGEARYPVWSRAVTQAYPKEGFRLPLQEYWAAHRDVGHILPVLPQALVSAFSYVAEHVSDDEAIAAIERLAQSVRAIIADGFVAGPWAERLTWLEQTLSQVWRDRGPYPGLPAVLAYLGVANGVTLCRTHLGPRQLGVEAWQQATAWLEGGAGAPIGYVSAFLKAAPRWRGMTQAQRNLLGLLARIELTDAQVERVMNQSLRSGAGIDATDEELLDNPYLLAELDEGGEGANRKESPPIAFESIDHAMLPAKGSIDPIVDHDDDRRVRALLLEVMDAAADRGDTILRLDDAIRQSDKILSGERKLVPDPLKITAAKEFHSQRLNIQQPDSGPVLIAAKAIAEDETVIRERLQRMVAKSHEDPGLDWAALVDSVLQGVAELGSEDEAKARAEKADGLARAFRSRLSVITGRAGTGKTTVAQALLAGIEAAEGKGSVLLLAPTGKARIRLQQATNRDAKTIHQVLAQNDWIRFPSFGLKRSGGANIGARTVVIDEASMIPTDLLATLFRAIDFNDVRRLVLMGDPNQLPPIGPGRPFVDAIRWLEADTERGAKVIRLEVRGRFKDANSLGLLLSDGYASGEPPPGDDEVIARVARADVDGTDVAVHFWDDERELWGIVQDNVQRLTGAAPGDGQTFDTYFRPKDSPHRPEAWQILAPTRRRASGTDELNRRIQLTYHDALLRKSKRRDYFGKSKLARPAGDQQIVVCDKVIQITNERRYSWSSEEQSNSRRYVANGEVGLVAWSETNKAGEKLRVRFGTQPAILFDYWRSQVDEALELAYAITVHKAQGSDFETVFLVLPAEAPTLTRELLYTALTRFRTRLVLMIQKDTRVLEQFRSLSTSETLVRNTNLFELSIRPEGVSVPYPEKLIHRTQKGVLVRSKSEVIVADVLSNLGISYQYEQRLPAKDGKDFRLPDFTVTYEGDSWYWEHLGMLDIPSYANAWERKQRWYAENGYHNRLLWSADASDGSIDATQIERTARERILDA